MTTEFGDPGTRLNALMARAHAEAHSGAGANLPPREVWARYFGMTWDPNNFAGVMAAAVDVMTLTADVRARIESLEGKENVARLLGRFGEVEAVSWNLADLRTIPQMQTFMAPLTDAGLDRLGFIADTTARYFPESKVPTDQLEELRALVDDALRLLLEDDQLDPSIQAWLIARLHDIRRGIDLYQVRGAEGLARSLDEVVGGLGRRPNWLVRVATSKTAQALALLLTALEGVIGAASTIHQLEAPKPESSIVVTVVQQLRASSPDASPSSTPRHGDIERGDAP